MKHIRYLIGFMSLIALSFCDSDRTTSYMGGATSEQSIYVTAEFKANTFVGEPKTDSLGEVSKFATSTTTWNSLDYLPEIGSAAAYYDIDIYSTHGYGTVAISVFDIYNCEFFRLIINNAYSYTNYLSSSLSYPPSYIAGAYLITKDGKLYKAGPDISGSEGIITLELPAKEGKDTEGAFTLTMKYISNTTSCTQQASTNQDISFSKDIVPSFQTLGCTTGECHNATYKAKNLVLEGSDIYSQAKRYVDTSDPLNSLLLTNPLDEDEGGSRHPSEGKVFSSIEDDYFLLWLNWIKQGAEDN
jgi:hypothetical protein